MARGVAAVAIENDSPVIPDRVAVMQICDAADGAHQLFVITGGPGSGKTTIVEGLRARGIACVDEVGRRIIQEQMRIGGPGTHAGDRELFRELMLSRMIRDYDSVAGSPTPVVFDRGIPGLVGYCRLIGVPVPAHLHNAVATYRYNPTVFVAPPWEAIYRRDTERKQDFAEAIRTFETTVAAYREIGYRAMEIPTGPVDKRVAFVAGQIGRG